MVMYPAHNAIGTAGVSPSKAAAISTTASICAAQPKGASSHSRRTRSALTRAVSACKGFRM